IRYQCAVRWQSTQIQPSNLFIINYSESIFRTFKTRNVFRLTVNDKRRSDEGALTSYLLLGTGSY
ncbi:hypothetical protein, partial [Portibacter marinus]|uniref:hypothetical protein n=1 Tax=Portibacter marinus TaxID=2898660 RepID=UPI001F41E674